MDLKTWRKRVLINNFIRQRKIDFKSGCSHNRAALNKLVNLRQEKIKQLKAKGVLTSQRDNTIYLGQLLPGCRLCKKGKWVCLFITTLCNRACFFCPAKTRKDEAITVGLKKVKSKQQLVNYIKRRGARGCGISGGEPLKVLDRTLGYIKHMRDTLGSKFHIWLYTNGDYVTTRALAKLKEAGLNEIRFNVLPSNYSIEKVKQATKFFEPVVVEIPAIPTHYHQILALVHKLPKIGVNHINLHELAFTGENFGELKSKGYKGRRAPWPSYRTSENVVGERAAQGSEDTAFRVLEHVLNHKVPIHVNYCSFGYKHSIQIPLIRRKTQQLLKLPHERVTQDGFCQKLIIYGPNIGEVINHLKQKGNPHQLFHYNKNKTRLELHPSLKKEIDTKKHQVGIVKTVKNYKNREGTDVEVQIL